MAGTATSCVASQPEAITYSGRAARDTRLWAITSASGPSPKNTNGSQPNAGIPNATKRRKMDTAPGSIRRIRWLMSSSRARSASLRHKSDRPCIPPVIGRSVRLSEAQKRLFSAQNQAVLALPADPHRLALLPALLVAGAGQVLLERHDPGARRELHDVLRGGAEVDRLEECPVEHHHVVLELVEPDLLGPHGEVHLVALRAALR